MANDNSFDPRSWSNQDSKATALPEAWQAIADEKISASHTATPVRKKGWQLIVGALAVTGLLAGGAWYWMLGKSPPTVTNDTPATVQPATAPAAPGKHIASRRLVLAKSADLQIALREAGLSAADVAAASKAALIALGNAQGEIQAVMTISTEGDVVRLERLEASLADGSGAVVSPTEAGEWQVSRVAAELSRQITVVRGEMDSTSFYSSAVAAGVVDSLIPEFINAFTFDFDLQQELAPGDRFEVAYEQTVNAAGQPFGQPQLLFASLVTAAKSRALYRFTPVGQEVGWFDGNGGSTVRSLMRTPVDGARISSKFGFRLHPVLKYMKLHRGTDFAAPTGTPIYASGDATVEFAAMKGANGNLTVLSHDNGWRTLYLHQSMFMPGIAPGVRVMQGQKIGEVGTTGRSTGPHLHYEVHIDGQAVDPQSIKTESGRSGLDGAARKAFLQQRDRVDVARARQAE
jgi:murein DD-endopeptidase MepM/ murein hydrolase activator NlpD